MSSYYEKIVNRAKEYSWWEERVNLFMTWGLFWLALVLMYLLTQQTEAGGTDSVILIVFLILFGVSYLVLRKKQKKIVSKEILLARNLLNDCDNEITLEILSKLITELDEGITNARKVAQWAIGGFITIFIFVSGVTGNLLSSFFNKVEIPKAELTEQLNSFDLSSIIEGIFMFTVVGFLFLVMIYPLLQIHTFSIRRYKKVFKNMEYILLENKQEIETEVL